MQNRRPLLSYILINILISALTTLAVLLIWSRVTALPEAASSEAQLTQTGVPKAPEAGAPIYAEQLRITTIIAPGDLQNERVLIEHVGEEDVLLAGWTLEDEDGNRFSFPGLVLHSGASVEVLTREGENTVTRLFWNQDEALWTRSETATLIDPNDEAQASYQIP